MNASYTHGVSTRPLIGKTMGDVLDEVAAEFAVNEAVVSVFENQRLTYARFRDEVNRCARAMMALGVQKGDRVGIWSTNCLAWVLVQFATAKLGVILVNINPAYRTYELEFALKQSECSVLISGVGFRDADYAAIPNAALSARGAPDSVVSRSHLATSRIAFFFGYPCFRYFS